MACWFNPASGDVARLLMSVDDGSVNNLFQLRAAGNLAADPISASTTAGGVNARADTTAAYSAGVWQHACAVFVASNSRRAYINGGSRGTNTTNLTPTGLNATRLGLTSTGVAPMSGRIAEAAIWDTALTDDEVAALAKGASPLSIRPGSLVFYAPLLGNLSPEPDRVGGTSLTVTGATKADHPPLGFARGTRFEFGVPTAAGGTTHERSAAITATTDVATSATYWTTFERSTAVTATTAVATTGQRDHLRSAAATATTAVDVAGTYWTVHERSTAVTATTSVTTAYQRDLLRAVAITALTGATTAGQRDHLRAVTVTATTAVATTGEHESPEPTIGEYTPTGILATHQSRLGVFMLAHVPTVQGREWTYNATPDWTYSNTPTFTYGETPDWTYTPVTG